MHLYIHADMYAGIFWNMISSVYIMQSAFICLRLTIWYWTTIWCPLPRARLCLPFPSVLCYLCVRFRPQRLLSIWFGMLTAVILVRLTFGQSCWWISRSFWFYMETKSHCKLSESQALTVFPPCLSSVCYFVLYHLTMVYLCHRLSLGQPRCLLQTHLSSGLTAYFYSCLQ